MCRSAQVAALVLVAGMSSAHAATINTWSLNSSGSWTVGGNWAGGLPTTTNAVVFTNLITANIAVSLDSDQNVYSLLSNTGSAGRVVTINAGNPTNSSLIVTSTATSSDGTSTFYALAATTAGLIVNAPVVLGDATTSGGTATFFSTVNSSACLINGVVSEASGQTWGVRIACTGSGIVNYGSNQKTYSGHTTITAGAILKSNADNTLPSGRGKGNLILEGNGQFQLNNVTLGINGLSSSSSTALVTKSGSNTKTFTVGNGDATAAYAGNVFMSGGTSGINKTGLGAQSLSGISVPGGINANAGTLLLNGTASGSTSTVAANATLGGTGTMTLSATLANNGILNPGGSAALGMAITGTLDVSPNVFNWGASSSLAIDIGGNAPGDGEAFYDQLNDLSLSTSLNLNSNSLLNLSLANGYAPSLSDVFYVFTRADAGSFSTLFYGTSEGGTVSLGNDYVGQITYLANWTGTQAGSSLVGGNDIAIYNVAQVPEPTSLAMFGLGAAFLLRRRSRT